MARDPEAGEAASPPSDRLIPRPRTPVEERRAAGVLDTKVSMPTPAIPVLPRPRLFELLLAATDHRVTVLNASAGAGKTILLASWLAWTNSPRAAWVTFDRADNEPKLFWSYVVEAFRRATVGREGDVFGRLSTDDLAHERFPQQFLDAVGRIDEPVVLVIDQAHEITDWRLLAGLDAVLRHAPASLRVVLSGRGVPQIGSARLRVAGDLVDIGSAELACSPDEARELFRLYDLDVAHDVVGGLLARTGGWMAGLRLAALWWRAQSPEDRDVAAFTGEEQVVAEYLQDEVIAPLSAAERALLLHTCVVDRVTGALADALTGGVDGQETLEVLERENALVTQSGAGGTWYRYGPLLREFLTHRLHQDMTDEVPLLRRRAALWYADQGMPVEAARNAVAARDWTLAARLLAGEGPRSFANGTGADLEELLADIPADEIAARADLAEVYARARLTAGDPDGAEAHIRTVERDFEAAGSDPDQDRHLRLLAAAELRLHQACLRGEVPETLVVEAHRLLDEIRETGTGAHGRRGTATLAYWIGISELWRGRVVAARAAFERAMSQLAGAGFDVWERRARGWSALLNAVDGRLGVAERGLAGTRSAVGPAAGPVSGPATGPIPGGHGRLERPDQPVVTDRSASRARVGLARPPSDVPAAGGAGRADDVRLMHDLAQVQIDVERDRLDQAWTVLESLRAEPSGTSATSGGTGLAAGPPAEPPLVELVGLFRARVLTHRGDLAAAAAELASARDASNRLRSHVEKGAALLGVDIALHENGSVSANGSTSGNGSASGNGSGTGNGTGAGNGPRTGTGSTTRTAAAPGAATGSTAAHGAAAGRLARLGTDPVRGHVGDAAPKVAGGAPRVAAEAVAEGRVLLAKGDPTGALDAVAPCLAEATTETRLLDTVGALLVTATAHRRLGTQAAAAEALERALTLARDEGLIRVFLDAGRGVRALLTVMIPPQGPHAGFRNSLLHRFDVQPAAAHRPSDQLTRLTASERAVLRYLPSHLTNDEIAQDLCLSVNTVKSHLRTLYRKLGVTCRREAIARALQLELLR
jgi:LuxR family transcriptional regulator, maltose regulon positive regulatory protein